MKYQAALILLLFIKSNFLFSQESKRDNIWMLGAIAAPGYPQFGIDFNSGNADTFSLLRPMAFFLTNASICDTNGQLLFYTNGNYVAGRNHAMMPNTAGFNPGDENDDTYPYGSGAIQGAIILPWPNHPDQYALFHMNGDKFWIGNIYYERPLRFYYSIVDMSLNGGNGDISAINRLLLNDTLVIGRISACKHANGRDWWILVHELWSNRFYEYLLTPDSIQFYQSIWIGITINHVGDVLGAGVFSNNGDKFAYLNRDTTLNIFDFDRCTGNLTNPIFVGFGDTLNLGTISCAFSSSDRYLYVCNNFHVFQLDMQAPNISASKTIVSTYDNFHTAQGFRTINDNMKLAPDKKIYISTYEGTNFFHVINAPDSAGLDCRVTLHSFILPYYTAFSMPNTPNYALGPVAGSICDSLSIGINEVQGELSDIKLYPNPVKDILYVSIEGNEKILSLKIMNSLMQEVAGQKTVYNQATQSAVFTNVLIPGIYYLEVLTKKQRALKKFVKY
jgi:hypothetical protein